MQPDGLANTRVDSDSTVLSSWRRHARFSLLTMFLYVFVLCFALAIIRTYGLDIVIPAIFVVGTCLGMLVFSRCRLSVMLGGSLGGAAGYATGGTLILAFDPLVRAYFGGSWAEVSWAFVVFMILLVMGLGGGLALACVIVLASRLWKAADHAHCWIGKALLLALVVVGYGLSPWP